MRRIHRTLIAAAGLAVALSGAASARQEGAARGSEANGPGKTKEDLTPQSFDPFRAMIRPHAGEYPWLKVHWFTDVVAVRKKAAAEDKPIVVLRTGGAGYNDPLGAC